MSSPSFSSQLMTWYKKNARNLPWRQTSDPYKIWVSEVMLQQTTVNAVIPYYERWLKSFPEIENVARAPLQKVLKSWQGLGYYSRARNLHKSAQTIVKEHKSQIPQDPKVLRSLPGFGPYTVGAVLSIAFDQRQPIIDANVRRVVMRQLAIKGFADNSHDENILKFLDKVMPKKGNNIFNQAMMELGALVCRREPSCNLCPVRKSCQAFKADIQEIIPKTKKKVIKNLNVSIGILKDGDRYFIQQRSSKGLLANLWEFPGGKFEKGETGEEAVIRELKEEIAIDVFNPKLLLKLKHFYTEFCAHLNVFACDFKTPPKVDQTHRWVRLGDLSKYPMPSGSAKILDFLKTNP